MLINEVCKKCSLTKKAVEYYIEQGLISPRIQENGYRCFSDEDVECLNKISTLRKLGLSVTDICIVLSDQRGDALNKIAGRKKSEVTALQEKQSLIQELADSYDWKKVQGKLWQLEKRQSVLERMMNVFPGYYGRFLCSHFALYLGEPIVTDEQQQAFDTIINFLDNTDFDIPYELQNYFDEALGASAECCENGIEGLAEEMSMVMNHVARDTEKFLADNREVIENYLAYKRSEEYQTSPAHCLEESIRQFNETSGYNDIFIPAMCRLSKSYREYHDALLKADEKMSQQEFFKDYFVSLQRD